MKIDSKMRRIQQKYKTEIEARNKKGRDALVVASIILFLILLLFLGVPNFEKDANKPVATDDYQKKWMDVTQEIDNTLKDNNEYTGIAIDFNPEPIKLILKTSLKKTNGMGDDHLNELMSIANESITSNNLPALLEENETYEIVIIGKNREEITRGTFRNDE